MNFKKTILLLPVVLLILISCKENVSEDLQKVEDQKALYNANPSKETAAGYVAAVSLYSSLHSGEAKTKELLIDASNIAKKEGQNMVSAGISNEIVKQFPNDENNKERLVELSKSMQAVGKSEASSALNYFLSKKYPEFTAEKGIILTGDFPENPNDFIKMKVDQITSKENPRTLDRKASFQYVDAVEAYAMVYPDNTESPKYLYHAAEVSKTIGTYKKSLSLYDWIINSYPSYENAPNSMFLKAFILEDNLNNIEAAKAAYELFIEKYPESHFVDDAQFSLNNLGKSDIEIQAELERLQKLNNSGEK